MSKKTILFKMIFPNIVFIIIFSLIIMSSLIYFVFNETEKRLKNETLNTLKNFEFTLNEYILNMEKEIFYISRAPFSVWANRDNKMVSSIELPRPVKYDKKNKK